MTVPLHRQQFNVRYSVMKHVREAFELVHVDGNGKPLYPVSYEDAFWDADRRDDSRAVLQRWVTFQSLSESAGERGFYLLQLRCSARTATVARRVTDRVGRELELMVQRLRDSFLVKCIRMYDFTVDPRAPAWQVGKCCFVQNSAGKFRVPEAHQALPPDERGVREQVLTYRIRTPFDGAGGNTYDVGAT